MKEWENIPCNVYTNMKKVIGIISAQYLPHLGGVERYTHNLAKHLVKKGYKVNIITSQLQGTKQMEIIDDIAVYRLPSISFMNGRMPVIKYNSTFRQMVKELDQINFDAIIINTRLYTLSVWGALFGSKRHIPVLLIEHGTSHMNLGNKLITFCGALYEHALTFFIKKNCHYYYGVSQACNNWLKHYSITANGVLYNAADPNDYCNILPKFRSTYNISSTDNVIAFVGRLTEGKGIFELIEAFEKINKNNLSRSYLLLAGDGEYSNKVKEKCNDHIIMLGRLTHEDVISLLYEADIYCLPTQSEGFPTTILEAGMCKCCIATTNVGGISELIVNDSYGYLMKNNDTLSIAEALNYLIYNPSVRQKMVLKCEQRVKEIFTWDKTADCLNDILQKL